MSWSAMPSKVGMAKTITTMYGMHTFVASKCMWYIVVVLGLVMVLGIPTLIMID